MSIRQKVQQIHQAYREDRLLTMLGNFLSYKARCARALGRIAVKGYSNIRLHRPDCRPAPDSEFEITTARRIFTAFRKMKEDQARIADPLYTPSSLWQGQLDKGYAPLLSGIRNNDLEHFHYFLANFGAWREYTGIEVCNLLHDVSGRVQEDMFIHEVFLKSLEEWRWITGGRRSLSVLSYPQAGNQSGVLFNGQFIGLRSFYNDIYGNILGNILDGTGRPVLADLGAGYGLLDYFTLRFHKSTTFIDFDLPETLCLAAYYLINAWPGKKVLLYGEAEYHPRLHAEYDLIFLPSWEIQKLDNDCIDLFLNTNSLGEMRMDAACNYLKHICRSARYLFHLNHETKTNIFSEDEGRSLVAAEFPIPPEQFRLLMRYPDLIQRSFGDKFGWNEDMFFYLYEKKGPERC